MTNDPLTRYLLLLCDRLLWQENSGHPSPKELDQDTDTSNFSQTLGKRINKHINFMKICMIFVPLFSQDTPMEWMPPRVRWFSFFGRTN